MNMDNVKQFISKPRKAYVEIPDFLSRQTATKPQEAKIYEGWLHFMYWAEFGGKEQICGLFETDKGTFLQLPIEDIHVKDSPITEKTS